MQKFYLPDPVEIPILTNEVWDVELFKEDGNTCLYLVVSDIYGTWLKELLSAIRYKNLESSRLLTQRATEFLITF